jgi:hypothetical protein
MDGLLQVACGETTVTSIVIFITCQSISAHFNQSRDCPNAFQALNPLPPHSHIMILISTNMKGSNRKIFFRVNPMTSKAGTRFDDHYGDIFLQIQ